jgi:predicted nucleotidyltransferase
MSEKLKAILAELRSHFEEIYGDRLVKMVLFGSQARGDADTDSDIDVLVVLKGQVNPGEEIKRTSHISASLSLQYDEVISRLFMDEHQFIHRNSPLLRNIRKEGIVL